MLGPPKSRDLGDRIRVSLNDLVPPGHFYRHLERTLDLTFVRDLVWETYAGIGRQTLRDRWLRRILLSLRVSCASNVRSGAPKTVISATGDHGAP